MMFEFGGAQVYYEQYGGVGPTLLLLHGWGGKCESWKPVIRDFQAEFRLVVVDFPGHGRSSEPPTPWSVTEYARLIEGLILHLGIEGCGVVGHSFGGRVAILLSAQRPELVGKLLLTGAAGIKPKRTVKYRLRQAAYKAFRLCFNNPLASALLGEDRADQWIERLVKRFGSSDYRLLSKEMRKTFNRVIAQDLQPYLSKIQSETLLIWGESDTETPLWMGKVMEREISGAQMQVLPGSGHYAYLDRFSDFKVLTKRFFAEPNATKLLEEK